MLFEKVERIGSLRDVDQLVRLIGRLGGIVINVTGTTVDYIEDGDAHSLSYGYVDNRVEVK